MTHRSADIGAMHYCYNIDTRWFIVSGIFLRVSRTHRTRSTASVVCGLTVDYQILPSSASFEMDSSGGSSHRVNRLCDDQDHAKVMNCMAHYWQ
jgi:hypothetical protein